jgi:uncharacterized protein (TIRG00374 family)
MRSDSSATKKGKRSFLHALRIVVIFLILAGLLFWALQDAPLAEIWNALRQLTPWQITILLGLNLAIYALITLRWWLIARTEKKNLPFLPLLVVRVSVFGISYFTLGPQVGGEPLQILYLRRHYDISYTRATSTVILDKLLEFLGNFVLLAAGLTAVFETGILSTDEGRPMLGLMGLIALLAWPPVHIFLMNRGRHPVTSFLRSMPFIKKNAKTVRFIAASERMAGAFCRRHFASLLVAILVSLLAAICMVTEFFLITSFLQIEVSVWQTIAAWTAGWLAFLVPWPGGLGALEASQVFAFGMFGVPAASAIGVALIIRGRDLLIGGIGLSLAGRSTGGGRRPENVEMDEQVNPRRSN